MKHHTFTRFALITAHNDVTHGLLVAALISRDPASLKLMKFCSLLHFDLLPDRNFLTLSVMRRYNRLSLNLIYHILDEFTPFHKLITVDINLLEEADEAIDHLKLLLLDTRHLQDHQFDELGQVETILVLFPDFIQATKPIFGKPHHDSIVTDTKSVNFTGEDFTYFSLISM